MKVYRKYLSDPNQTASSELIWVWAVWLGLIGMKQAFESLIVFVILISV